MYDGAEMTLAFGDLTRAFSMKHRGFRFDTDPEPGVVGFFWVSIGEEARLGALEEGLFEVRFLVVRGRWTPSTPPLERKRRGRGEREQRCRHSVT